MIPKEEHCKGCGEWLPDDVDMPNLWDVTGKMTCNNDLSKWTVLSLTDGNWRFTCDEQGTTNPPPDV